jgi:para-nitrobenzyl esterase
MTAPTWPSVVATASGSLGGFADEHDTLAWLGVPFGAPPTGERRWRAPADPHPWEGVRPAQAFAPAPFQPGVDGSSEDCLYLNVWRPASDEAGLPVYVWLPGGGNTRQVPAISDTPGALLAERSRVVVVTVTYRVGEMGWFSHPALREGSDAPDASGNYGSLDIIKALGWVRDNIAGFGGDPANVLLTGESAGAFNTLSMLISPMARGLFHKAMAQSGRTNTISVETADDRGEAIVARLLEEEHGSEAAGQAARGGLDLGAVASFLRTRTPEQVAAAARGLFVAVFNDGAVIDARGFDALDDGSYANKVPVIVGMNQEETKLFLATSNRELREDRERWEAVAGVASAQKRATGCDAVLRRLSANADQPPVYGYLFRWGWGGEHESPLPDPWSWRLGAAHGMDIPFFWHGGLRPIMAPATFTPENEAGRVALAEAMMGYLARFAHEGVPGPPSDDLPVWEPWSNEPDGPKHIVFDADHHDRLVSINRHELTTDEVRAQLEGLPPDVQKLATRAEASFRLTRSG